MPSQIGATSFRNTLEFIRKHLQQWLYLSFLGLSIPVIVFQVVVALLGAKHASNIRYIYDLGSITSVEILVSAIGGFVGSYLLAVLATGLVFGTSIFALVQQGYNSGGELRIVLRRSVWLVFRKGLWLWFLLSLVLMILQFFEIIFFVVSSTVLMTPALIAKNSKDSVFRSIKAAITLSFGDGSGTSRWGILFQLVSYASCLYLAFLGIQVAGSSLLRLDDFLPVSRDLFSNGIISLPYLGVTFFKGIFVGLSVGFYAVFTSQFLKLVEQRKEAALGDLSDS